MKLYWHISAVTGTSLGLANVWNMDRSPAGHLGIVKLTGLCIAKGISYGVLWPITLVKMSFDAYECEDQFTQHLIPGYCIERIE